jgi:effector-binding domain-containing protein
MRCVSSRNARRGRAKLALDRAQEEDAVGYEVRLVVTPARPTAVVARATTWDEFPSVWRRLLDQVYAWLKASDVGHSGHNVMLYKDDVPNVEVGVEVDAPFTATSPVVASALPAGEAATTLHCGPYEGLDEAHRAVWKWCAANGRQPSGPRWEIYGDWHEDSAQLQTEVYYLLA